MDIFYFVVRFRRLSGKMLAQTNVAQTVSRALQFAKAPTFDAFESFTKLPPELRLKIWEYAAPEPRIVELTWNSRARSVISLTDTPTVLHICSESRQLFINSYTPVLFGNSTHITLVDFTHDTIFFGRGCQHSVPSGRTDSWTMQNLKVIRDISTSLSLQQHLNIAAFSIPFILAIESGNRSQGMQDILRSLPHLKEIILVRSKPSRKQESVRCGHTGVHSFMSIENSQCERCVETCSAYQRCFLAYTEAGVQREVRFSGCEEGRIPGEMERVFRECEGLGTVSGLDFVARLRSANSGDEAST